MAELLWGAAPGALLGLLLAFFFDRFDLTHKAYQLVYRLLLERITEDDIFNEVDRNPYFGRENAQPLEEAKAASKG